MFWAKISKLSFVFLSENFHFLQLQKSLYIVWARFRNELAILVFQLNCHSFLAMKLYRSWYFAILGLNINSLEVCVVGVLQKAVGCSFSKGFLWKS